MTADQYRRRIEQAFRACEWGDDNPFKAPLLARLGGQYRPSTATDDRHLTADEDAVALMRHYPEAMTTPSNPF